MGSGFGLKPSYIPKKKNLKPNTTRVVRIRTAFSGVFFGHFPIHSLSSPAFYSLSTLELLFSLFQLWHFCKHPPKGKTKTPLLYSSQHCKNHSTFLYLTIDQAFKTLQHTLLLHIHWFSPFIQATFSPLRYSFFF